jgi:Zn-dependent metalloprotease
MKTKLFPWGLALGFLTLLAIGCDDDDDHPCVACPEPNPAIVAALDYVEAHRAESGLRDEVDQVSPYRVQEDELGMTHVRCHQLYKGVRVEGGELIVHLDAALEVFGVSNGILQNVEVNVGPVNPDWTAARAARDDFQADGFLVEQEGRAEKVVFRWFDGDHLCWVIVLHAIDGVDRRKYFVDAQSGEIVHWRTLVIS